MVKKYKGSPLAQKLLNAIKADPAELRLLQLDHKNLGSSVVTRKGMPTIPAERIEDICGSYNQAVSEQAPQVLRSFLDPRVIQALDLSSFLNLFWFCIETAQNSSFPKNAVFSIGYGGSYGPLSLRIPVYVVPAAKIMQELGKKGIAMPTLRIFSGQMAGIEVNKFNPEKVWPITLSTFAITKLFLDEYFPKISERTVFDFDRPPEGEVKETIDRIVEFLNNSESEELRQVVRVLRQRGMRHGREEGRHAAIRYAAVHPLMFGDILTPGVSRWLEQTKELPIFFSFGGPPEGDFNFIREEVTRNSQQIIPGIPTPKGVRFIVSVGKQTVYYPPQDDLLFRNAKAIQKNFSGWESLIKNSHLLRDFNMLGTGQQSLEFINWAAATFSFFERAQEIAGNGGQELLSASIVGSQNAQELLGQEIGQAITKLTNLSPETIRGAVIASRQEFLGYTLH